MTSSPARTDSDRTSAGHSQDAPAVVPKATRLAYDRAGSGEPLILLHGQGFSRRSWDPVIAGLAVDRDVIAVDLPGHGDSPRQPRDRGNTPHDLAIAVAELLDQLSIPTAHVAGNSLGGWVALELGRLHRARTVTALSPAGLWRRRAPRHIRLAMRQARLNARVTRRLAPHAPRTRLARGLAMLQVSGRPFRLPYDPVRTAVHDMATAPGFRETLRGLEPAPVRRRRRDHRARDHRFRLPRPRPATHRLPPPRPTTRPRPMGHPGRMRARPHVRRPARCHRSPPRRHRPRHRPPTRQTHPIARPVTLSTLGGSCYARRFPLAPLVEGGGLERMEAERD